MADAFGAIGQSNEDGQGDWLKLASPASPADLAHLQFFQIDLFAYVDDAGAINPMVFSATHTPASAYDYPPNIGFPTYFPIGYKFGPEVYGGLALWEAFGADPIFVKLSPGGTYLTDKEPQAPLAYPGSWFWPAAHRSWDTQLARDTTPYSDVVVASGTATASTVLTMTDPMASLVPNAHIGHWCLMGANKGLVIANTATEVTVLVWVTSGLTPPTPGAYTIVRRTMIGSSLSKAFVDGYCPAAFAAAGGTLGDFDMKAIQVTLGESDSLEHERALLAKENMLDLIWYIRNRLVAQGLTSLPARKVAFSLALIVEGTSIWPYANITNQLYRELADSDPWVRIVAVEDLERGGFDNNTSTDNIHYNHNGQKLLGQRHGAAMVELVQQQQSGADPGRGSHHYYGQHVAVTPVWGAGSTFVHRLVRFADLTSIAVGERRVPGFYARRDAAAGWLPLYISDDGDLLSNRPQGPSWTLVGFASPTQLAGMVPASGYAPAVTHRKHSQRGCRGGFSVAGFVWPMASGGFDAFPELLEDFASASQTHTVRCSGGTHRITTEIPAASVNRDWLLRGASGAFAFRAELRIDEKLGAQEELWMRHRIGWGDYRAPQVDGTAVVHMPPIREQNIQGGQLYAEITGLEFGCDEGAPSEELDSWQVNHGGVAANGDAVVWTGVRMRQEVTPNWNGIEGCFRVVHEAQCDFALDTDHDAIRFDLSVFATNDFDQQLTYDPATGTTTDKSWDPTTNRFHIVDTSSIVTYDKTGGVHATAATPFTQDAGVVAWCATGTHSASSDGLTWGVYLPIRPIGSARNATQLVLGNWTEPLESTYAGFSDYDQRNYSYAQARFQLASGTPVVAGQKMRVAMFVLVGTADQMRDAADALYALGVDATWTD